MGNGRGSHAQKERFKQGIKESKNLRSDNLAKDGTYRGGRRVRAGDKPKPVAEKIQAGEMIKILANDILDEYYAELESVDLPEGVALEGMDMPKPSDYLSAKQKSGIPLGQTIYIKKHGSG